MLKPKPKIETRIRHFKASCFGVTTLTITLPSYHCPKSLCECYDKTRLQGNRQWLGDTAWLQGLAICTGTWFRPFWSKMTKIESLGACREITTWDNDNQRNGKCVKQFWLIGYRWTNIAHPSPWPMHQCITQGRPTWNAELIDFGQILGVNDIGQIPKLNKQVGNPAASTSIALACFLCHLCLHIDLMNM